MRVACLVLSMVSVGMPPPKSEAASARFSFAPVGYSYLAFLPSDDPRVGQQVISARFYLDVEFFPGSDAANFFTDITFPIEPIPGNKNGLVLVGQELGWSGAGHFHFFDETDRFNGQFVPVRFGGETPGENFDGIILDSSRIEFEYVPEPTALALLVCGAIGVVLFSRTGLVGRGRLVISHANRTTPRGPELSRAMWSFASRESTTR